MPEPESRATIAEGLPVRGCGAADRQHDDTGDAVRWLCIHTHGKSRVGLGVLGVHWPCTTPPSLCAIRTIQGSVDFFHISPKQDISTRYASALFGITNAGASLGGLVFVYLVGIILDQTKSWSLVFSTVAVLNFISAAVYALWANCEPQFE